MLTIKKIKGLEILDSRGNPTVATFIELSSGVKASALVPSGASTGRHEAFELRDGGKRYQGLGVRQAVKNIENEIAKTIVNKKIDDLIDLDYTLCSLDGTVNKQRLGANAILGVSMAYARACAYHYRQPLFAFLRQVYGYNYKIRIPIPMMNILNGGKHADNGLSIQEFMIVPKQHTFAERLRAGAEIYHVLKKILKTKKLSTGLGDEGGFAPRLLNSEAALQLLIQAIKMSKYKLGKDIFLALDVAASEFFDGKNYNFENKKTSIEKLINIYKKWIDKYSLLAIEDGLAEDDWLGWQKLTKELGAKTLLVGDDLFVTNQERLQQGIDQKVANAILIKLNQIGTVTETMQTVIAAQKNNYKIIISHRSGETTDDFIADLAVAVSADYIKSGAPARSERLAKYNRLLKIEHAK